MNRVSRWLIVVLIALGCVVFILFHSVQSALTMPDRATQVFNPVDVSQKLDLERHFRELDINGSISIYDLNNNRTYQYNPQRNATPFLPASTFKIPNSLIALETGVISNELFVLTWDGIERAISEWNRDLNMKEAIELSAVWFYQVLARRVGHDRMQKWVTQIGYGNQKIGGKADIDRFWLQGELRITPQQQIEFLTRLYKNDLPFSERSLSIVKNIMILEKTPDYTLRGKTGWVGFPDRQVKPEIGWLVGYLEKNKNVYFFATNIDISKDSDASKRMELTRRCFKDLGLL
jgi:beta-lactamase class D